MTSTPPPPTVEELDRIKRKAALKNDALETTALPGIIGTPPSGGMSVSDFKNKWIPQFEEGFVDKTPDATDTPYGRPYADRPRITILAEG